MFQGRVEKDCALFSGLIAGLKESWSSKKRHAAAERWTNRASEKDISGSKKAALNEGKRFSVVDPKHGLAERVFV